MERIELIHIINYMVKKGYVIYEEPYKLNLFGIRNRTSMVNLFNERIGTFYKTDRSDNWDIKIYSGTTKPGLYYLRNLINPKGTLILKEGQYVDTYKIDYHRGEYLALCQRLKPVTVFRDKNRDDKHDYDIDTLDEGYHGANIHRASMYQILKYVDRSSAGCQVIADPDNFNSLMELAEVHKKLHGNKFTYTLMNEEQLHIQAVDNWLNKLKTSFVNNFRSN